MNASSNQEPTPEGPGAVPRLRRYWYVACMSQELRNKPMRCVIFDTPLVLFRRADGSAAALEDECPHRQMQLSLGSVVGDLLQCPYHGWQFDGDGQCRAIPGYLGNADSPSRAATSWPVREQDGFIWVYAQPGEEPIGAPSPFPITDDKRYLIVKRAVTYPGSIHMVAENALDVPHTAFVHGGLFRVDTARNPIHTIVHRWHDRAEAEYIGEPRPAGLVARLIAPGGGDVVHFDRFFLPSVVQVDYRLGDDVHLLITGACTPVSDWETRLFAIVAVRTRFPKALVRPILEPFAMRIFRQDVDILRVQTEQVKRAGVSRFASTELDLLGPHILRLLRRAESGNLGDPNAEPYRREVDMMV